VSLVDDVRKQIDKRLNELKPLVDEYQQLEAMVKRLAGGGDGGSAAPRRRGPGRPRGSRNRTPAAAAAAPKAKAATTTRKRRRGGGRPKGSGTRAKEALALVKSSPGISIPDMAKQMGITPNYLYRVLPDLQKQGKVKKKGKGWHAS
jgi:predicted Rossmann fold nucleotide-binding protein DprA/Smf involved in DNA uptake